MRELLQEKLTRWTSSKLSLRSSKDNINQMKGRAGKQSFQYVYLMRALYPECFMISKQLSFLRKG